MTDTPEYDQLGSFYLGKKYELAGSKLLDEKVLYDSKDMTTMRCASGMTGSGKTGLCISLLEEAALDGIPAICIDPKGDLGNLMLAFPKLSPSDFEQWVEPAEAGRAGMETADYAAHIASAWRDGLNDWDQDAARIGRFRDAVDISIYTPGSNAGLPLTVLRSFDAPAQAVLDDPDVMRERVAGAAAGLLTLMGHDFDPLSSREYILLSNILDHSWRAGKSLSLAELIRSIQSPPIEKVGVFDLESFFPAADRAKFSMSLNNLLASPTFAGWLEGEPLDIQKLMYTDQGKPRLSIISIAHLSDSERMFFVTILLNELLGWMRSQAGTSSLRALFYMDEVYGYFPPTAKPPSKPPMMVLLKQARAFGLGMVLATQNPVDLDYKGLSNIGTWFLGRLQTQRDKERVLEGLEGAAAQTGSQFDRGAMEQTLAALGKRVFLMNNVHDNGPTIFQTRWAMSYLRGPLSRLQISRLMEPRKKLLTHDDGKTESSAPSEPQPTAEPKDSRPIIPNDVEERFWSATKSADANCKLLYRPALLADVSCHYVRISADVDDWFDKSLIYRVDASGVPKDVWRAATVMRPISEELSDEPDPGFRYAEVPAQLLNDKEYRRWGKEVKDHLYRREPIRLYFCKELKKYSRPGDDELDARMNWKQEVRELRDEEKDELRKRYSSKLKSLESKIRTARQRIEREKAQYDKEKWNTLLNLGQTMLGAILGNKVSSRGATTGRSATRAAQQRTDVVHANETLDDLIREKLDLERECDEEIQQLKSRFSVEFLTLEPLDVPCRKGDLNVKLVCLLWVPWQVDSGGIATPLVDLPQQPH